MTLSVTAGLCTCLSIIATCEHILIVQKQDLLPATAATGQCKFSKLSSIRSVLRVGNSFVSSQRIFMQPLHVLHLTRPPEDCV